MPVELIAFPSVSSAFYSNLVGFIFIFNIIVGTGALTLPAVFAGAGWCLSLFVIVSLAIISYMTVTFVIETIACANAIKNWQTLQVLRHSQSSNGPENVDDDGNHDESFVRGELETVPLTIQNEEFHYYQLGHKFELGEMAKLFFNDFGRIVFNMCLNIYLYGDLSIYSAAVARSLRDVICDHLNNSDISILASNSLYWPGDFKSNEDRPCWIDHTISRLSIYRIMLIGFAIVFGPLVLCGVQKTKYLQVFTAVFRWMAFTFMVCFALKLLITNGTKGHPVGINIYGIPSLFGACVYSFMCHHSLPSLIEPIRNKSMVGRILTVDYIVICIFYIVLAMTGIFAFEHVDDLYTLNFLPYQVVYKDFLSALLIAMDYFLSLFPVFTLSASFPVIAVTLKNNLQIIFLDMSRYETYSIFIRCLFPLLAIIPPICVTYFSKSLSTLVAFTGSYAGSGIQYVIPVLLVYFARRTCSDLLGSGIINHFQSPFKSNAWLALVLIWSVVCVHLVTINLFI